MTRPPLTSWHVIELAAAGRPEARREFAQRYEPVLRAYLEARWRGGPLLGEAEDAVQDVFVECFREGGALERAQRGGPSGFRGYLYGVVRNVALLAERRRARAHVRPGLDTEQLESLPGAHLPADHAFEQAWARSVLKDAAERQRLGAATKGAAAERRVELLRLRFEEGLPIREIAARWGLEAAPLHHEYATAREEYRAALQEALAFQAHGDAAEIDRECQRLLGSLE